jgi:hypothetical protein
LDLTSGNTSKVDSLLSVPVQRLKEKLVRADSLGGRTLYGATNQAFISDDVLTSRHVHKPPSLLEIFEEPAQATIDSTLPPQDPIQDDNIIADDAPGDERESWDSKVTFLLATIG